VHSIKPAYFTTVIVSYARDTFTSGSSSICDTLHFFQDENEDEDLKLAIQLSLGLSPKSLKRNYRCIYLRMYICACVYVLCVRACVCKRER